MNEGQHSIGTESGVTPVVNIGEKGDNTVRAFPDPKSQIPAFVSKMIEASRERQIKNARIASKLHSETPWAQQELDNAGLGWKSNFTSRPLTTLISRAHSRFPRAIRDVKYLTSACLPYHVPGARTKTERYRERVTKFLRSDPRWDPLIEDLAFEDVTYGWCAGVWLDEMQWLPNAARQDELFVPPGTKQHTATASCFVYKQELLVHDAYALLQKARKTMPEDEGGFIPAEEAKTMPKPRFEWDLEKFAKAINNAVPADVKKSATEDLRVMEDLRRQMSAINAFGTGNKMVILHHVFCVETTGKVSHYIADDSSNLLFAWEDRYDSLTRCASFFALELGDRSLLGSKGVGRICYTIASIVDRSTNDAVDRFALSGKLFVKAPEAKHRRFRLSIVGNIVLIDDNYELIPEAKVQASMEESVALDNFLAKKLDEMAGTVGKVELDGERVTAAAVNVLTAKEGERQDNPMSRWLYQFGMMVTEITRRLCFAPTDDQAVAELRNDLASFLTPEEVQILAGSPALTSIEGWTVIDRQMVAQICTEAKGNPLYDQRQVEVTKISALHSPDLAEALLLQEPDPTIAAEQTRQQLLENGPLLDGVPVPISARDNHVLHLETVLPIIQSALQESIQNPQALVSVESLYQHAKAHTDAGVAAQEDGIEPYVQAMSQIGAALDQIHAEEAKNQGARVPGLPEEEQDVPEEPPLNEEGTPISRGIGLGRHPPDLPEPGMEPVEEAA